MPINHLNRLEKMAYFLPIIIIVSLSWCIYSFMQFEHIPNGSDFEVFYVAGQNFIAQREIYHTEDIYNHTEDLYNFRYAPSFAFAFGLTFSQMPLIQAKKLFYLLSLIAWFSWGFYVARELVMDIHIPDSTDKITPLLLKSMLICSLFFVFLLFYGVALRDELKLGQANIIPLILVTIFTKAVEKNKLQTDLIAGIVLVSAILIKPFWGLFVLPALFQKKLKLFIGMLIGFLSCNLLLVIYNGFSITYTQNINWLNAMLVSSLGTLTLQYNVSLLGMITKLGGSVFFAQVITAFLIICFIYFIYRTRNKSPLFHFIAINAVIPILNPIVWPYWILFTVPAFFYIILSLYTKNILFVLPLAAFYFFLTKNQNSALGYSGGVLLGNMLIIGVYIFCYNLSKITDFRKSYLHR